MKNDINNLLRYKRQQGLEEVVFDDELDKLKQGMPIQKIVGFVNFDDLQINVNRNVLIPRYETEEVVMFALEKAISKEDRVLDLCSGSGYIGLTIKHKMPTSSVVLADISDEAIMQSEENSQLNNLDVEIIKSDLFSKVNGKFNVIISNPPYIPKTIKLGDSVLDFEPHNALFAEEEGNYFYRKIIENAPEYLEDNGWLIFEMAIENKDFLEAKGFQVLNDINKKPRIAFKQFNLIK